jgi:16S rRNA (cytidine1402-2'-O)-methyltransferase
MPKLYIVATPIGNLKDITLRALDVLKEVDLILCEDTRVTKKLLEHYNIKAPSQSYHQHSKIGKINYIVDLLKQGKDIALVSDSGTPGISDPGNMLIKELAGKVEDLKIIPIPGPNAAVSALSISGFPTDKFVFMGFPPHKNKRNKFFREVANYDYPVVLYESPYRIIKTLKDLKITGDFEIVVCREMTKMFETIYRGKISEIIKQLETGEKRGEFIIIVNLAKGRASNYEK